MAVKTEDHLRLMFLFAIMPVLCRFEVEASPSVFDIRNLTKSYSSYDGKCNIQAVVRAEDLYPQKISHGQIKIITTGHSCTLIEPRLELRLVEYFHQSQATRERANFLQRATEKREFPFNQPILAGSDLDYFDQSNYTVAGELTSVFSVMTTLADNTVTDTFRDFQVHMPNTNFPAVDGGHKRARGLYIPTANGDSEDLKFGYTSMDTQYLYVLHGRIETKQVSLIAGRMTFHPRVASTFSADQSTSPKDVACIRYTSPIIGTGNGRVLTTSKEGNSIETLGLRGSSCYSGCPFFEERSISNIKSLVRFNESSNVVIRGSDIDLEVSLVDQQGRYIDGPFRVDVRISSQRTLRRDISLPSYNDLRYRSLRGPYGVRHEMSAEEAGIAKRQPSAMQTKAGDGTDSLFVEQGMVANALKMTVHVDDWAFPSMEQRYQNISHALEFIINDLSQNRATQMADFADVRSNLGFRQRPMPRPRAEHQEDKDEFIQLQWSVPINIVTHELSSPIVAYGVENALEPIITHTKESAGHFRYLSPESRSIEAQELVAPMRSSIRACNSHAGSSIPRIDLPRNISFVGLLYKECQDQLGI